MLRIAVCDDIVAELRRITAFTNDYLTKRDRTAEVQAFSHPEALLTACETQTFHIFLLDIVMPMVSGLELGRSIRRASTDAQIIFITTEPSYALDAYAVNPLHYLIKPVDKTALFQALDLAAERTAFGETAAVTIKTKAGLRTFSIDRIRCCEYRRHTVLYTLITDEQVETTTIPGSFAEHIAPLLRDRRFIQPHAAFVINMSAAERLDKSGFTLTGGVFVPVSGKQYAAVRKQYMDYRLSGVRDHANL